MHGIDEGRPAGDAADGEPVAQTFSERQKIRRDAVGLVAPEMLPGPAPSGLDLVSDKEDAELVKDFFHGAEESVGGDDEAAYSLDGLRDQAGHIPGRGGANDVAQVGHARLDVVGVGQVPEGAAIPVAAVDVAHVDGREAG